MAFRITMQTQLAQAQRNVQGSKALLNAAEQQAATQRRLTVPSDDPTGTAGLLAIGRELAQNAQYSRNVEDGQAWLSTVDSTLTTVTDQLTQLRNLAVQAGSGTNSAASRQAIATQMQAIKSNLLALANTQYLGRNVFAGGTDAATAFSVDTTTTPPTYTYNGAAPGAAAPSVERRISPDTTVRVDADGGQVFGEGAGSVFALIDSITSHISGPAPSNETATYLAAIDGFEATIGGIHSTVGSDMQQIQQAGTALQTARTNLVGQQSAIQDADPAEAILQVQTASTAYQVALAVTAKAIQPTLMDYLH